MKTSRLAVLCIACVSLLVVGSAAAQDNDWRTIEFETTEVTGADVALSPDGETLMFTIVGHLFRLPVEGGTAEQLTFGPYYDSDPVFSPDGNRVAFVSNRDGNEANVFVLELATGQITQVTHEPWARRPTWTPDGQAIVYLSFRPTGRVRATLNLFDLVPALVRWVSLDGEEPDTLNAPRRLFRSVFYLPDGRLAWTVVEREGPNPNYVTRIEVRSPQGVVSTVRTLNGVGDRTVPSPAGDGFYWRGRSSGASYAASPKHLSFAPMADGANRYVFSVPGRPYWDPQFAVAADNQHLYVGQDGQLWKIALPRGTREHIAFAARVRLEIQAPTPPPTWGPTPVGSSPAPRSVLWPRLSPDGLSLVFGAAGYLWQQALDGGEAPVETGTGQAERLFAGSALEWTPAFSPDGRQLAFVRRQFMKDDVNVFDFASRQTHTVASGPNIFDPSWSPDGQRLVFAERDNTSGPGGRIVAVHVDRGTREVLNESPFAYGIRPHFSADGQSVYFSAPGFGTAYRLPLEPGGTPQPIVQLARYLRGGLVSPDGQWFVFERNAEIWVAPLGTAPVGEEDVRQLSPDGSRWFAFSPDGSAVIYATGHRVWRHPLAGGEREEIPIRLVLPSPTPSPLLVRGVRVLDFAAGGFGPETSLFLEQGRIRWMGSERGHALPPETVIVEAGGRFAIPGLFDMHAHITGGSPSSAREVALVVYGVTSARQMGGFLGLQGAAADRGEATSEPVPRYFFAGEVFQGPRNQPQQPMVSAVLIYDEDDARMLVRRGKERGAQFIKAYNTLSWPVRRAVSDEARRLGLPVAGHNDHLELTTKSVTLGYASLAHLRRERQYDDVLQMLALAGTHLDPTLGITGGNRLLLYDEPERLADTKFRAFTREREIRAQSWSNGAAGSRASRGNQAERLANIRAAHLRGVKLLAGTDYFRFSGSSLHWELEYFVQAGIPPLDVLRIATQEAAEAVGAADELGTLDPGKLADLVLLDANPLDDIKNTQTIWRTIKGGWVFDPDELRPPAATAQN